MQTSTLKNISEFIRTGKTPPTKETKYFNGDIHWYTPGDLDKDKCLGTSARSLTQFSFIDKKAVEFPAGTLLVACIGDIGKLGITTQNCSSNQQITGIKPNSGTDVNYLYYWFRYSKKVIQHFANNAVVPIINNGTLGKIKIPLPPLPEQQKIASVLDAADSLRQKDQQLIEKYTALSQSLFLDMFGDPVNNPKGWSITALGNSLVNIVGGKSVGGEQRQINDKEKAVLKISAVTTGVFNALEYKVVDNADLPETLVLPRKGNLLFSRANTRELVGATCIVDKDYDYLFLPDKLWRLDLKSKVISNWYLRYLLNHEGFRENLRKVATGTSGSMLNISKAKLNQLKIPQPPITLQNEFEERIQAIEAQKQQAQASLHKSEDLFNSLLQRAFKGELTQ
jgi:type I restriction enzyme S subunit